MSGTKVEGTSTLARPKFGPGMLLQHDDLEQLTTYTRELNRLMFRSLFGCGVVCGLVVKPTVAKCDGGQITVGMGLALSCNGDPIYVPKDQTLPIDDKCDPTLTKAWVILCAKSKNCAPRTAMCASDEDETTSICTRERDAFEIRVVQEQPDCACNCEQPDTTFASDCLCADPTLSCHEDHYAGICSSCGCTDCKSGCSNAGCVVLAYLTRDPAEDKWIAHHYVRRFIRPILMRDPQAEIERQAAADKVAADTKADGKAKETEEKLKDAEGKLKDAEARAKQAEARAKAAEAKAGTEAPPPAAGPAPAAPPPAAAAAPPPAADLAGERPTSRRKLRGD